MGANERIEETVRVTSGYHNSPYLPRPLLLKLAEQVTESPIGAEIGKKHSLIFIRQVVNCEPTEARRQALDTYYIR